MNKILTFVIALVGIGLLSTHNVAFSDISGYLNLPGGSYNVKVRPAGQESPDVINTDISVNGGKKYTVVAAGNLDEIHALVFEDRVNAPRENRARVRVIHLSPDAQAYTVFALGYATGSPALSAKLVVDAE